MKINQFIRNLQFNFSHPNDNEMGCRPWAAKSLFPTPVAIKNLVEINLCNFYWRCRGTQSLWAKSSESRNSGSNDNERERGSCIPRLEKYIDCVPRCLLIAYLLRPKWQTANLWIALPEEMSMQIVKQYKGFHRVLMQFMLYRITCTHTELASDTDSASVRNRIVMSWYFLTFKQDKKLFFWRR
jgi:hypothetical protein